MFLRRLAIILCVLAVGIAVYDIKYANDFAARFIPVQANTTLPPLSFEDGQHKTVTLHDFAGRYVLLNLWATWCGPCVREMPALDKLATLFDPQKLTIIALNENSKGFDAATKFYQEHGLHNLGVYTDPAGHTPASLNVKGLPTTILINTRGEEVGRWQGTIAWDSPKAVEFITHVINPPAR